MKRTSCYLLATLAACSALPRNAAAADATGPAATAVNQWFATDRSLGCFDRQGNDSVCGPWIQRQMKVYYGGEGNQDALAVVTYVNDPTGNAEQIGAAYFHQDGGSYRFVKTFKNLQGHGVASGSTVRFANGKAMFTMETMRPGDSACCLTGRTPMTLSLR